jgi:hypothetical protein
MTTRKASDETAHQAYCRNRQEIERLLCRLSTNIRSEGSMTNPDWGHVGSLAHIREKLQDISDFVFNEGEYAE